MSAIWNTSQIASAPGELTLFKMVKTSVLSQNKTKFIILIKFFVGDAVVAV